MLSRLSPPVPDLETTETRTVKNTTGFVGQTLHLVIPPDSINDSTWNPVRERFVEKGICRAVIEGVDELEEKGKATPLLEQEGWRAATGW